MPAPTKVELTGGHFQDAEGNVLALGTLVMELVQDEQLSSLTGQVCAGIKVIIKLNNTGSVDTSTPQSVWSPESMIPAGASYTVWGYTAEGQPAWGPNYGLDVPIGATFDVSNWIPNTTGGGSGSGGSGLTLQTNETNNGSQALLDLHAGSNVTLTDNGSGQITIAASGGGAGITLQTNEVPNGSQTLLDLHAGSNVTLTDNGSGRITIAAASSTSSSLPGPSQAKTMMWEADIAANLGSLVVSMAEALAYQGLLPTDAGNGSYFSLAPTATEDACVELRCTGQQAIILTDNPTTNFPFYAGRHIILECKFRIPDAPSLNHARDWIGLFTTVYLNLVNDAPGGSIVGLRYSDNGAGAGNFFFVTANGTSQNEVDSGIAADNADHTFKFEMQSGTVHFYLDGVLLATTTTDVPLSTDLMYCAMSCQGVHQVIDHEVNLDLIYMTAIIYNLGL